ncbi:uncharacterized protein LOC135388106 isoform X2 [Ornithodoros turicata]|uniref:uncharacterized protein LOC135388106 isoform X2 n=1 Tax=Ornithodoros turicata TaxID=34597 RepID=UPI00313949DC
MQTAKSIHPNRIFEMDGHFSPIRRRRPYSDVLFRTNKVFRMYAEDQGEYIELATGDTPIPSMPDTPPEDTALCVRLSEVRSLAAPPTPQASTQTKKEDFDRAMQMKSCQTTPISPPATRTVLASPGRTVVASTPSSYSERFSEDPPTVPESRDHANRSAEMPQLIRAEHQADVPAHPSTQPGEPYNRSRKRLATPSTTSSLAERKATADLEILIAQRRKVESELKKLELDRRKVAAETLLLTEEVYRCEEERKKLRAEADFFLQEKLRSEEEGRKAAAKATLLLEHKNFYVEQQKTEMVRRRMLLLELKKVKQDFNLLR